MDGLGFWGYALLAVVIAVSLSSVELLTKHQSRSLREIFASGYYVGFALLNAFFCFLVYWALPSLSGTLFSADLPIGVDTGLGRALAAALGYLVVARLSFLDITTKTGETYGAGFDAIYNGVAQYLLRHHNRRLRRAIRADFFTLYSEVGFPAFLAAAELQATQLDATERTFYQDRISLALMAGEEQEAGKALLLYQLLREHDSSQHAAELIRQRHKDLKPAPED